MLFGEWQDVHSSHCHRLLRRGMQHPSHMLRRFGQCMCRDNRLLHRHLYGRDMLLVDESNGVDRALRVVSTPYRGDYE